MIRESFHWTGQKKGKGGDDDNATMFSGQKRLIDYCLMSIFGVATSFRLRVRNNFSIFFLFRMFYYFLRRRCHDATHTCHEATHTCHEAIHSCHDATHTCGEPSSGHE